MEEVWKDIRDFEDRYQVSNFGRVRSKDFSVIRRSGWVYNNKSHILTSYFASSHRQYEYVSLKRGHVRVNKLVHRLVAEAFIENPLGLPDINHKDENTKNNFVSNLEWCTRLYNNNYGTKSQRESVSQKLRYVNNPELRRIASEHSKKVWADGLMDVRKIAIDQYDRDGNIIMTHDSITSATRNLHTSYKTIVRSCEGNCTTRRGYLFQYHSS